jgi:hypothetical protein
MLEPKENEIISIYSDDRTLGGIIYFRKADFIKCNGFPNNFWGWGVEDKALQNRVDYYKINVKRLNKYEDVKKSNLFLIFDDINDRIRNKDFQERTCLEYDVFSNIPEEYKTKIIKNSGLII